MSKSYLNLSRIGLVVGFLFVALSTAQALPALQLGPDPTDPLWTYNSTTQTWEYPGLSAGTTTPLNAYANADPDTFVGVDGAYAWDPEGAATQTAYLVIAAVPDLGFVDSFDVTVNNDGGSLIMVADGYGSPPVNDPNSLASHGIFDTYFEIYEFNFDQLMPELIGNTQPGDSGTGIGFVEQIDIIINSLLAGVTGLHVDLFTVAGDGIYSSLLPDDKKLVNAFAPFSHDAQIVPLPAAFPLFAGGLALLGLLGWRRKRMAA